MMRAKSWFVAAVLGLTVAAPAVGWADQSRGFDGRGFEHRHGRFQGPAEARPFRHVPPPRPYAYAPYRRWDERHQGPNPRWNRRHEFREQRWDRDCDFRHQEANPYARREHLMRERERFDPRMGPRERYERSQQAYADPSAPIYADPQSYTYNNSYAPGTTGDPRFDAAVGMIPLAQQMFQRNP